MSVPTSIFLKRDTTAKGQSTSRGDTSPKDNFFLSIKEDYATMMKEDEDTTEEIAEGNARCDE
jgi:hypothetical protein